MKRLLNRICEQATFFSGRALDCKWVTARLQGYWSFDLRKRELGAVEKHLHRCPDCSESYKALRTVCETVDRAESARLGLMSPEATADAVVAGIFEMADGKARCATTTPCKTRRCRPALALLSACLLLLVAPALAYVAGSVLTADSSDLQPLDTQYHFASSDPTLLAVSSHIKLQEAHVSADSAQNTKVTADPDATAELARIHILSATNAGRGFSPFSDAADQALARSEIEALLPNTEEEYEAWARREYPHIMALYDILTGRPSEAWPWLSADIQTFLGHIAGCSDRTKGALRWDGVPINIPEWARRLYADTPEYRRPTGWRCLVIYSGEFLKLDWPYRDADPNVRPTLLATEKAAFIAGYLKTPYSDPQTVQFSTMPEGYLDLLTSNRNLTPHVLNYQMTVLSLARTLECDRLAKGALTTAAVVWGAPQSRGLSRAVQVVIENIL